MAPLIALEDVSYHCSDGVSSLASTTYLEDPLLSASFSAPSEGGCSSRDVCVFYMRTGTCAYGDRCRFSHPLNRPLPVLNSKGYPQRPGEPSCPHYLKKGWCAFAETCKFNHPDLPPPTVQYDPFQKSYVPVASKQEASACAPAVPATNPYYCKPVAMLQPPGIQQDTYAMPTTLLVPPAASAATLPSSNPYIAQQLRTQQQQMITYVTQAAGYSVAQPSMQQRYSSAAGYSLSSSAASSEANSIIKQLAQGLGCLTVQPATAAVGGGQLSMAYF